MTAETCRGECSDKSFALVAGLSLPLADRWWEVQAESYLDQAGVGCSNSGQAPERAAPKWALNSSLSRDACRSTAAESSASTMIRTSGSVPE